MVEKLISGLFTGIFAWCIKDTVMKAWAETCNYWEVKTQIEEQEKAEKEAGEKK
jgi:hypothetical protein